ncbi:hypothetical protein AYK21_04060 [Thermoplasmatales archaeon SG8-52-2]|nr:MAG: hypothetical protein AYK21_04060 [Thermoplasmatales archaeon SG8-52-2]
MKKRYMVWWHSYVDEIHKENVTLKDIYNSVSKSLEDLNKLILLEDKGKIKVKNSESLNPIFIEILDSSIESEVVNNPIVDVDEEI